MHVEPKRGELAPVEAGQPRASASRVRYAVLGAFCLAATIAYVQRNSIGVAESTIRTELGLTTQQTGWVMSAFLVTYALLQIPSGALTQRWGTRRALSLYSLLWSIMAASFSLAGGFWGLTTARLGQGAAQAGIFPSTTVSIGKWVPASTRAIYNGILSSFMSLGGASGAALTGLLLIDVGWRATFALFAVPGVIWAAVFYLWFRDDPADHPSVNEEELRLIRPDGVLEARPTLAASATAGKAEREPTPWRAILGSWAMFWIGAQQFFRAAGYLFFATWFATYLQETRGASVKESGLLTTLPLVAVVLAGFVGGTVSDLLLKRTGSRRIARQAFSVVCLLLSTGLIVLAYFVADPLLAVLVISFGTFIASLAGPCAYAISIDMGGRHVAPVFSMMNMLGNLGGLASTIGVPWFVEQTGQWDAVLFLFAGIYLAAALCWIPFDSNGMIVPEAESRPGSPMP
jgi:MFS family permease